MKYQFFMIPAAEPEQAQEALNRFCHEHRVVNIDKAFVQDGCNSYWSLCVGYLDGSGSLASGSGSRRNRVDYREILDEQQFALFAKLRDLRKSLAEKEGIPAYALFTNEQLATIVRNKVSTKTELAAIEGIGDARLEKYADAVLEILKAEISS